MKWEVVIGLETHAQLSTASKIFSGAATAFGAAPNTQASAVDIALPGVLPVLNRGAVERAIRFGLAVGATIHRRSVFARKNYFYPDLPKGYQISQYEIPIVQGGSLTIATQDGREGRPPHARASRGGRGQEPARGLPRDDRHRLEPRRHAAPRNRLRARHAKRGRGRRLCEAAARARQVDRHLRRQHAGGELPLRRQRVGPPRRRPEARHTLRDQESQQLPLHAAGDRVRGAAPDRAHRATAARSSRRRASSIPIAARRARCEARKTRRTTATSPIPTCRRSRSTTRGSSACVRSCPNCPRRCRRASRPSTRCRCTTPRRSRPTARPPRISKPR